MEELRIEQLMYGYHHGHTRLAASLREPLKEQGVVDLLSDASGQGIFSEYLTCFPLVEDGYYAFAKTWYAAEMPRPGCVWTHMLLVPLAQIELCRGQVRINDLFQRPRGNMGYENYKRPLAGTDIYECMTASNMGESPAEPALPHYDYVIYTFFSTNKKVYICDRSGGKYEDALLDVLVKLPVELLSDVSVCTNALTNRFLKKTAFTYQISEEKLALQLAKEITDSVAYKPDDGETYFPLWTKYVSNKFQKNEQEAMMEFFRLYHVADREGMKELSKVQYAIGGSHNEMDLEDYLSLFQKIDHGERYADMTVDGIFYDGDERFGHMFDEKSIINYLSETIVSKNKNGRGKSEHRQLRKDKAKKYAEELYNSSDKEKLRRLFDQYIHSRLNQNGELLVDALVGMLIPEDLYSVFDMHPRVCSVLIRKRPGLASCSHIWRQERDFQLEVLDCISRSYRSITREEKKAIIEAIVLNSDAGIVHDANEVFGEGIRKKALLEIVKRSAPAGKKPAVSGEKKDRKSANRFSHIDVKGWILILLHHRDSYLQLLKSHPGWCVASIMMENLNSYEISDAMELQLWAELMNNYSSEMQSDDAFRHALFCLPVVLRAADFFDADFKEWVFSELNEKLEQSQMNYEDWRKLEALLPQVSVEQSWDRCLRLRMAFGKQ